MKTARSQSGHTIVVVDADGQQQRYEADEVRTCDPTAQCMKFWATFAGCVLGIGVGLFLMVFKDTSSALFPVGTSLLSLSFGILIPGPKYEAILPKKVRSRHSTPEPSE